MHKDHDLKGEQKSQLLQLVDDKGIVIGEASREECHKGEGKAHLAFMAFIFDENNNLMLTQRSSKKSLWNGYWDAAVVSHVLKGETVESAANRRGKEELGVDVTFKDVGAFYYKIKYGEYSENEYCHVLTGSTGLQIIPNEIEVASVKKISKDEFDEFYLNRKDQFTPWFHIAWEKYNKQITSNR